MAREHADLTHEWIAATWDQSAPGYDLRWGHGLRTAAEHRAWSRLMRRLLGEAPLRLLDVGCGTGVLTLLLARLGHDVVGVDLSAGMLARAGEHAARDRLQVAFQQGSAEATGFADAEFDAVVSRQLLWSLTDPVGAVREWARVTKPGGRVIAIDGLWHDPRLAARLSIQAGTALARLRGVRYHRYDDPYWDHVDQLPLSRIRGLDPARNAFVRAGLDQVLAEHLDGIDQTERAGMPLHEKLRAHYRRYLIEGTVPAPAPS